MAIKQAIVIEKVGEAIGSTDTANAPVNTPLATSPLTESVQVYDAEKDTYVTKQVPVGESLAFEPADTGALDMLDTSGYDKDMRYYWCNKDTKHQAEARRRGYAPVRESPNNAHPVMQQPGNGSIVSMGDLVLFGIPREFAEKREIKENAAAKREEIDRIRAASSRVEDFAADNGLQLYGKGLERRVEEYDLYEGDDNRDEDFPSDFAHAAAASYEKAATAAGMDGGRAVYAGFNGPMGPGVPPSPIHRR